MAFPDYYARVGPGPTVEDNYNYPNYPYPYPYSGSIPASVVHMRSAMPSTDADLNALRRLPVRGLWGLAGHRNKL